MRLVKICLVHAVACFMLYKKVLHAHNEYESTRTLDVFLLSIDGSLRHVYVRGFT